MSRKERERLLMLSRVKDQGMTLKSASGALALSYRQTRRIYKRYLKEGDAGLIHKSRGRPSGRGFDISYKGAVLNRYKDRYTGFGPTLAAEKLVEDGFVLDHETLRRWLLKAGLISKRRKKTKHRKMRERRECFGELVQMDGSHHSWFEDRGDSACLMNMVDDASGTTLSLMDKEETTEAAMILLLAWINRYGIPEVLYVDRKNVFITDREPTLAEQLRGEEPLTHFGKACKKLSIRIMPANSPQAKGRVERNHGVYQDRLVKELRIQGINTIDEVNRLLKDGFIDNLNIRFAADIGKLKDRHRLVDKKTDLFAVFSYEEERSVANDFTVRYLGRIFQIEKQTGLPCPGKRLIVQKRLDKSVHLIYQDHELRFKEISVAEKASKIRMTDGKPKGRPTTKYIPPVDHPWRQQRVKPPIAAASR